MTQQDNVIAKRNVDRFNSDVTSTGSYAYTGSRLSSRLANGRISDAIRSAYDFRGKRILDLGCGDGSYTVELSAFGAEDVLGIDPAAVAIEAARHRVASLQLADRVHFETGNIYALDDLLKHRHFDCIVLRGVLHHLPDPARAIAGLAEFKGSVIVLEPNGLNPVLKLLERFSRYHIEHEERSFTPGQIRRWLSDAGLQVRHEELINLVPFFCPEWMARLLRWLEPWVERTPALRAIACGQTLISARR